MGKWNNHTVFLFFVLLRWWGWSLVNHCALACEAKGFFLNCTHPINSSCARISIAAITTWRKSECKDCVRKFSVQIKAIIRTRKKPRTAELNVTVHNQHKRSIVTPGLWKTNKKQFLLEIPCLPLCLLYECWQAAHILDIKNRLYLGNAEVLIFISKRVPLLLSKLLTSSTLLGISLFLGLLKIVLIARTA